MDSRTTRKSKRRAAAAHELWRRSRPIFHKDMSRQDLAPTVREAFLQRVQGAATTLLEKYPELRTRRIMVDWSKKIVAVDNGKNARDDFYTVYYFSEGNGPASFGAAVTIDHDEHGRIVESQGLDLTDAPDAVLACMIDDFDDFLAAVERTVCGALFLDLDARREGGKAICLMGKRS